MERSSSHRVDLSDIARLVVEEFEAAPGAVVAAARQTPDGAWTTGAGAWGKMSCEQPAAPTSLSTFYDLASLTKPVLALTTARLAQTGAFRRSQRLAEVLPKLGSSASAQVPLDLLMSHRSGLEAHVELYDDVRRDRQHQPDVDWRPPENFDKDTALSFVANAMRMDCRGVAIPEEGFAPVYSDLGYQLCGAALEAQLTTPLDEIMAEQVFRPLKLRLGSARQLALRPGDPAADSVAPTEYVPFRGGLIRGVVHDDNAWVLSGTGTSGHAGLFGDVWSVLSLGQHVVDAMNGRSEWMEPKSLHDLLRRRPGGTHRAGFDGRSMHGASSGSRFGPDTFGHLGFTGTSLWIDPDVPLCGVILSNRVHPSREHIAIRKARPAAYDAIYCAMVNES